jgi:hypothetical protein
MHVRTRKHTQVPEHLANEGAGSQFEVAGLCIEFICQLGDQAAVCLIAASAHVRC